jgi:hypothetical protein
MKEQNNNNEDQTNITDSPANAKTRLNGLGRHTKGANFVQVVFFDSTDSRLVEKITHTSVNHSHQLITHPS